MENRLLKAYGNRTSSTSRTATGNNRLISGYSDWEKKRKQQEQMSKPEPIIPKPIDQVEHEKKKSWEEMSLWEKTKATTSEVPNTLKKFGKALEQGVAGTTDEMIKGFEPTKNWEDMSLVEKSEATRKELMDKITPDKLVETGAQIVGATGGVLKVANKVLPMQVASNAITEKVLGRNPNEEAANYLMNVQNRFQKRYEKELKPTTYNEEDTIFNNPKLLLNPEYVGDALASQVPHFVLGALSGGIYTVGVEGGGAMQERYTKKQAQGEDVDYKDVLYSSTVGTINGILEKVGINSIIGKNKFARDFINKSITGAVKKYVAKVGVSIATEDITEYLQEVVPQIAAKIFYDEGGKWSEVAMQANKQGLQAASQATVAAGLSSGAFHAANPSGDIITNESIKEEKIGKLEEESISGMLTQYKAGEEMGFPMEENGQLSQKIVKGRVDDIAAKLDLQVEKGAGDKFRSAMADKNYQNYDEFSKIADETIKNSLTDEQYKNLQMSFQTTEKEPEKTSRAKDIVEALSTNDRATADKISADLTSSEIDEALMTLDKAYRVADPEMKKTIGEDMDYLTNLSAERLDRIQNVAGEVVAKKSAENLENDVEKLSVSEVQEVNELLDKVKEKTQQEFPKITNGVVEAVKESKTEISELQNQKKELLAKKNQVKKTPQAKEIQTAIDNVDEQINGLKDFIKEPKIRTEAPAQELSVGNIKIKQGDDKKYQIFYRGSNVAFTPKKFDTPDQAQEYFKQIKAKKVSKKQVEKMTYNGKPMNVEIEKTETGYKFYAKYDPALKTANYSAEATIEELTKQGKEQGLGIETAIEQRASKVAMDGLKQKTQKEKVIEAIKESPKTIKEIAEQTKILEPNVRRILGVGAKEGVFERIEKGVYVLSKDGVDMAYIQAGDAVESLPKLAKEGFKADMIFLDIPYKTAGVVGGNRGIDYDTLSVEDFRKVIIPSVIEIARTDDSPIVYMYSNSKSGLAQMVDYNNQIIKSGLQVVAKGTYTKTYKSGKPMKFGQYFMPPEGILIFNKSGKEVNMPEAFDIKAVAPLYKGHYQTEKSQELLNAIIKGTTKVGDMVFDPFAGSGVAGEQAIKEGRKTRLIEKSEKAVEEHIKPRIKKALEENETPKTPRDIAKELIRAYVERGDDMKSLHTLGMASAGNWAEVNKDKVLITRLNGKDVDIKFSLKELYDEIKGGEKTAQPSLFSNLAIGDLNFTRRKINEDKITGAEMMIAKLEREQKKGEISEEDLKELTGMVNDFAPMLDDVMFKVFKGGMGQGSFEYTQRVLSIFTDNIKKKTIGFKRTLVHEIWHALTPYLSKEDLAIIKNQFEKEQSEFLEKNPEYKSALKLKDETAKMKFFGGSLDTYKYYNIDEWFAEKMSEETMPEIAMQYGQKNIITRVFEHIRSILKAMYDAVSKTKGERTTRDIFKDFVSGKNKDVNFKYGLEYYLAKNKDAYFSETGEPFVKSNISAEEWDLQRDLVKKKLDELLEKPDKFTNPNNTINFEDYATMKGLQEDMDKGKDTRADLVEIMRMLELYKSPVYLTTGIATAMIEGTGAFKIKSYLPSEVSDVKDLTTPILEQLKGKDVISKQFISDLAKRQEVKQVERDLINKVLEEFENKVDVKKFIEKVNSRLLPLRVIESDTYANYGMDNIGMDYDSSVNPPKTHIYDSPFKHGRTGHFSSDFERTETGKDTGIYNYDSGLFGHTRVADDVDESRLPVRYVLEIQSDIFQGEKGTAVLPSGIKQQIKEAENFIKEFEEATQKFEKENEDIKNSRGAYADTTDRVKEADLKHNLENIEDWKRKIENKRGEIKEAEKRLEEMSKNEPLQMFSHYKNTWHERLIREEVARAAKEGVSALRFPIPYTVAKIEGFIGESAPYELMDSGTEVGDRIDYGGETMVIVKSYGDGSFQAVAESAIMPFYNGARFTASVETLADEDAQSLADEIQYEWDKLDANVQAGFEAHKDTKKLQKISDDADYNLKEVLDIMYNEDESFDGALETWKNKKIEDYDAEDQFAGMGYDVEIDGDTLIAWEKNSSPENFDSPDSYRNADNEADFNYENDLEGQEQKTVVRFYDKQVLPYVKKIRKGNAEIVEDPNGNSWLETKINKEDNRPVVAFLPDMLEKAETETEKYSNIVNKRTELMKQRRGIEKEFEASEAGTALKEKTIIQEQAAIEANKNVQQGIKNNPRFIKEGTVSDAMGSGWLMSKKGRQVVVEANKVDSYIERGYQKDIEIDSLASEAGFENGEDYLNDQISRVAPLKFETAVKKHLTYTNALYQNISEKIADATAELNTAKDNKNAFFLGMKVGGSVMRTKFKEKMSVLRHRKEKVSAAKDFFKLSDSVFKKIGGNRDVQYMSNEEFDGFMKHLEVQAEKEILHANAKAMVIAQIQEKQLRKTDNLRRALKLPTIDKMTTEQLKQFDEAMETAQPEDEFLTQRMIETLRLTELAGIRTVREAREILNKKLGKNFEEKGIKISPLVDRLRWDTPLAESNEFMNLLVEEKDMAFLKADAKTLIAEEQVDKLTKKARKSIKRTIGDRLVPEDPQVFEYLESDKKSELAKDMTPEQLELATWLEKEFETMRDYLIQNEQLKSYRENYITHIRKDFLETWKNDGLFPAIKGIFEQQQVDEAAFEILSGETEEILPFEKWFQFAMRRSGIIDPSKNVERAYIAYKHVFERKVALDSLIPKIMTYVYSLTPTKQTEKGLVMDRSIRKFVISWLNSKKGRKFDFGGFLKQGSKADSALLFLRSFTTLLDLGASIPIGIASNFGEQSANFVLLGTKQYAKGVARLATPKGRKFVSQYENFVGKTPFKTISQGFNHIGNKFMGSMFYLFHSSQVRANKMFLLGAITDEEYNKGEVSVERLAKMKIAMGRWRVVEGSKSIIGNTSIGNIATQYKTWAIVMMRTTLKNAEALIKNKKLNSREGRETVRQITLMSAVGLMTLLAFTDDDDNSFLAVIYKKIIRDALSAIQALDPTLYITDPRVLSFLIDLSSSLKQIITLETYAPSNKKQHGELKGLNKLIRTLKPNIYKQFEESDYVAPKKYNITD